MWAFSSELFLSSSQIEDGEIYASINQRDGMVCFHDNPEKYNNPAMLHKIDQEVCNNTAVNCQAEEETGQCYTYGGQTLHAVLLC